MINSRSDRSPQYASVHYASEADFGNQFLIPEITFYRIMNLQGLRFASRAC